MHQYSARWILGLLLALTACTLAARDATDASASNTSASNTNAPDSKDRGADADVVDATLSEAETLCETLHDLAARRKQACCNAPASSLSQVCSRELAAALERGAVRIDSAALDRCRNATTRSLQGCDWVGPLQPALPAECSALIAGSLKAGTRCQSSLECSDGLYCHGASPLIAGVCAAPARPGSRCERPADNLASFARAADDPRHPSCDGICLRGQCLAAVAEGGSCHASAVCANGLSCAEGKCSSQSLPALGATCSTTSGCADSAICLDQKCAMPKAGGASCKLPFECRSLECRKNVGEETGLCVDACQVQRTDPSAAIGVRVAPIRFDAHKSL